MSWEEIISEYKPVKQRPRRIWVNVPKEEVYDVIRKLREAGFEHLSAISVTDWLNEGVFEVTYHLWSYSIKTLLTVKTKIPRDDPVIKSVVPIYGMSAWIHERELHEMFGVVFEGNPDLSPLFLEDWDGPPPFRKDFNWRDYVREKFYSKERERDKAYWEVWLK